MEKMNENMGSNSVLYLYASEFIGYCCTLFGMGTFHFFKGIVNALFGNIKAQAKNEDTSDDYFIQEFHIPYRRQFL